jgi:hypothetical protein
MREFLAHMWDMEEQVPLLVYEPGDLQHQRDGADLDEELTLCYGADIVLVGSEEERQMLLPYFAGKIELRSEQATREILSQVRELSRTQEA